MAGEGGETGSKSKQISWMAEGLRVTLFHNHTVELSNVDWWQNLVGEEPEKTTLNPRVGTRRDDGHVDNSTLSLIVKPRRIDWYANPPDLTVPANEFSLGRFEDAVAPFQELISRWFENDLSPKRLAFGAALTYEVESPAAGYRLLADYLPNIEFDFDDSSDFLYQINRPRDSQLKIGALRINRLAKWSVVRSGTAQFEVSRAMEPPSVSLFPTSSIFACRLELDINTAAEHQGELPHNQLSHILNELVELGQEIAIGGDIP